MTDLVSGNKYSFEYPMDCILSQYVNANMQPKAINRTFTGVAKLDRKSSPALLENIKIF